VRQVILGLGISLDGYIARPNGALDFLFMPKDYSMAPFFATIDTGIMGRKTFDAAGGSFNDSSMAAYVFPIPNRPANEVVSPSPTSLPQLWSVRSARNPASISG
jgi:dihydrofolate reductase